MKKSSDKASDVLLDNYEKVKTLFEAYKVSQVRLFGSLASLRDSQESDVDFLVDLDPSSSLIDYGMLKADLEDALKRKVDILTYTGLDGPVLEFFKEASISFEQFRYLTKDNAIKSHVTLSEKTRLNLKSMVWVMDRIFNQVKGLSFEDYMADEIIQDAMTRNLQVLGQVANQLLQVCSSFKHVNIKMIRGFVAAKEALYLNVDHDLVMKTVKKELKQLKSDILCELEELV